MFSFCHLDAVAGKHMTRMMFSSLFSMLPTGNSFINDDLDQSLADIQLDDNELEQFNETFSDVGQNESCVMNEEEDLHDFDGSEFGASTISEKLCSFYKYILC